MQKMDFSQVFTSFSGLNVMVIGDVMVDAYLFGNVDRISPEAPVPIVSVGKRINRLGGAANVALNLKSIGVTPVLCSVIGNDLKGDEFLDLLQQAGIHQDVILRSAERITTTKFRIIGNKMQMLRVDEEITNDLGTGDEEHLISKITQLLDRGGIHAIILQDYNKGILTAGVIRNVVHAAVRLGIPVVVDPKRKNFELYTGVTLFKPNLKEIREGLNLDVGPQDTDSILHAADLLHERQDIRMVMVTLSEAGVFISEQMEDGSRERHTIPAHVRNIADVSGAGDTVVSVATACLAAGLDARAIAQISNLAGGLVCEEVGVVPVNRERLVQELKRLV